MDPTELTITGHLDGFCLRFGAEVVAVFKTWDEVVDAYNVALAAAKRVARLAA